MIILPFSLGLDALSEGGSGSSEEERARRPRRSAAQADGTARSDRGRKTGERERRRAGAGACGREEEGGSGCCASWAGTGQAAQVAAWPAQLREKRAGGKETAQGE